MISEADLKPIAPKGTASTAIASQTMTGLPIAKTQRVQLFSPDDWELFTEEYAFALETTYSKVRRFGGAGDMGLDVACFVTDDGFMGDWDNFQCKRYDHALRPSDIWVEIGKVIYYSYVKEYTPPRRHYFCASQGTGTTLERLLNNAEKLKDKCREEWASKCQNEITSTQAIELSGELLAYFEVFDFKIFSSKSVLEMVEAHSKTQYHAIRFGGGLPPRPTHEPPPAEPLSHESRYVRHLLDAYGEHAGEEYIDLNSLSGNANLNNNFRRQRERFYHAEALRNFARDTVPEGTFAQLQEEIYQGVVDVCETNHTDGFARMSAAVTQAAAISSTSNPLSPATSVQDRQGICHQLANDDRLQWVAKT